MDEGELILPYQNSEFQDISNNIPNQQLNIENVTTEGSVNLQPYFTGTSSIDSTYLNLALQPKSGSHKSLNWNVQVPIIVV